MTTRSFRILAGGLFTCTLAVLLATSEVKAVADEKLTFELYKDDGGEFRWRLKDGDKNIGTSGQGYKAKADAKNGIERIKKDANSDKLTFEVYEDNKKEYRWKVLAKNGNNMGSSSGGYEKKADAEAAVKKVKDGAAKADVKDLTKN